jgi:hypothetical protein
VARIVHKGPVLLLALLQADARLFPIPWVKWIQGDQLTRFNLPSKVRAVLPDPHVDPQKWCDFMFSSRDKWRDLVEKAAFVISALDEQAASSKARPMQLANIHATSVPRSLPLQASRRCSRICELNTAFLTVCVFFPIVLVCAAGLWNYLSHLIKIASPSV